MSVLLLDDGGIFAIWYLPLLYAPKNMKKICSPSKSIIMNRETILLHS